VVRIGFAEEAKLGAERARLIEVPDTLEALGRLAAAARTRSGAKVIAVTGSVGKTTVKEALKNILISHLGKEAVLVTEGNFNNLIGLPLTLLSLGAKTKAAVVEMGASLFGEIETLTLIAKPDVGLVTAAGEAHLEFFGNLAGVAKAKGELYRNLPPGATAVVNAQDRAMMAEAKAYPGPNIYFGFGPKASLRKEPRVLVSLGVGGDLGGQVIRLTGLGLDGPGQEDLAHEGTGQGNPGQGDSGREGKTLEVKLRLLGAQNALNAAGAAATAWAMGIGWEDIRAGLENTKPFPGRLEPLRATGGRWVINDSYNANPTSMAAALGFMAGLRGRERIAILGDMLELGPKSRAWHARMGEQAAKAGIAHLALVGPEAKAMAQGALEGGLKGTGVAMFENGAEAARWALKRAPKDSVILVKGSRGARLETAVRELLVERTEGGSGPDAL
jgi:UDP-N-acetylmuramyl pentapeptide synthase